MDPVALRRPGAARARRLPGALRASAGAGPGLPRADGDPLVRRQTEHRRPARLRAAGHDPGALRAVRVDEAVALPLEAQETAADRLLEDLVETVADGGRDLVVAEPGGDHAAELLAVVDGSLAHHLPEDAEEKLAVVAADLRRGAYQAVPLAGEDAPFEGDLHVPADHRLKLRTGLGNLQTDGDGLDQLVRGPLGSAPGGAPDGRQHPLGREPGEGAELRLALLGRRLGAVGPDAVEEDGRGLVLSPIEPRQLRFRRHQLAAHRPLEDG